MSTDNDIKPTPFTPEPKERAVLNRADRRAMAKVARRAAKSQKRDER